MGDLGVDSGIFAELLAWAAAEGIPDFKDDHARDGLFSAERYLDSALKEDRKRLFLLALDVTFWFWMDDRVDQHLTERPVVDWGTLLESLAGRAPPAATAEGKFLDKIGAEIEKLSDSAADHQWWVASAARSLLGFREEEAVGRGRALPSLVEYLENGVWSMPLGNIVATASSLYHMNVATRRQDQGFADTERYLCLYARLENDLHGFEKERREQSPTNSVLLMEQFMPTEKARAFVGLQKEGYGALLRRGLDALAPEDAFVRFVKAMLVAHEEWYGGTPQRYETSS